MTLSKYVAVYEQMGKSMVEFFSKFEGHGIKIDRFNSIRIATSMIFFNILGCHCIVSDVIMSYRFVCVELASTSVSLYTLSVTPTLDTRNYCKHFSRAY